jgi:hypothetical protein
MARTGLQARSGLELVETSAEPFQDGLHGWLAGKIALLGWILALVEELLSSIPLVADVDERTFGPGDQ